MFQTSLNAEYNKALLHDFEQSKLSWKCTPAMISKNHCPSPFTTFEQSCIYLLDLFVTIHPQGLMVIYNI